MMIQLNYPLKGRAGLLSLLLLLMSSLAFSQTRHISGKVLGPADGAPVQGASIEVKGTTTGTSTAEDGSFTLTIPNGAKVLVVSAIGFATQEIPVGSASTVTITLQRGTAAMDEVVVVGYGTQRRREVTSAVSTVKPEDFRQSGARNALDVAQGKIAGLNITRTSSNPNSGVAVLVRGATSVSGNNSPLIVIDGIPGGNLDLVQQEDIASIDVLKDGSAAAIYGSRANGGVILITTKKGKAGPARFEYSSWARKEFLAYRPDFMTADEYREKIRQGLIGQQYDLGGHDDQYDQLINHNNLSQYHTLAMSGGANNTSYRASLYYQDLQGIAVNNGRTNYGGRLSINQRGFHDRLTAQLDYATNFNRANMIGNDIDWETAFKTNPTRPLYNPDGTFLLDVNAPNQLARLRQESYWRAQQTSSLNGRLTLDLYKGLSASVSASLQRNSWVDDIYRLRASASSINSYGGGGYAYKSSLMSNDYSFEPTINYSRTFASDHAVTALAGYSYQYSVSESFNVSNTGFINDIFRENNLNAGTGLSGTATYRATLGSDKQDNKTIAFFGRVTYAFRQKLFGSLILRHEGASRFGVNNKWGDFPAVSAGWDISKESFMRHVDFVNTLKLRVGYGITGTQPNSNFQSFTTLSTGNTYRNPDGVWRQTYGPDRNPNPNLRWEKKKELNIGADFSLFQNRLSGALEVFNRRTEDLLGTFETQLPANVRNTILANVGTITNKGVELTLSGIVMKKKDFSWDMDATASTASSRLVKFNDIGFKGSALGYDGIPGPGALGNAVVTLEGDKLGQFWGKRFAGFDANGKWLFYKRDGKTKVPFNQINTSNDRTVSDLTVIGNAIPKYYASWTNTFRYKGFDMRIFLRGKFGFDILNVLDLDYATRTILPNNVLNKTFKKNWQINDTYQYSDYYLEKGDYVKIDEVSLGYTFKFKTDYIHNLHVYAAVQNLYTITGYSGNDPDTIDDVFPNMSVDGKLGTQSSLYPRTRSITVGLNLAF